MMNIKKILLPVDFPFQAYLKTGVYRSLPDLERISIAAKYSCFNLFSLILK
jgi:hypothetical protein